MKQERTQKLIRPLLKFATGLALVYSTSLYSHAQIVNRSGEDSTIFVSHTVFVPKAAYDSGMENWGVDLGDVDKDGDIDVISCSNTDGLITVHFNDGKGRLTRKTSYPGGKYNRSIVCADFNKDTWPDLATVSVQDMMVNWLINDGTGSFKPKKSIAAGGGFPHDITCADVNQDGNMDLVTVTNSTNKVNLHYGDGAGNFIAPKSIPVELKPRSVIVTDLNNDKIPDLVVGTDSRTLNILMGTGGGAFGPYQYLISGVANWGVAVGDFDKNGFMDIASADYMEDNLSIHLNTGKVKAGKLEFIQAQQVQSTPSTHAPKVQSEKKARKSQGRRRSARTGIYRSALHYSTITQKWKADRHKRRRYTFLTAQGLAVSW